LIVAHDLASKGYTVTIFEALHEPGGVLRYGVPPFRLPRQILRHEMERVKKMGVEFRTNVLVGSTRSIEELFADGYDAVFIGTGAGLPRLMGIPGEDLIGVYTANEFLTRLNLMEAHRFPESDTPVRVGARTLVVGGGNSAIDAARWARRLGSETSIVFRRGRDQLRARREEIEHAEQEGIAFLFLAAPVSLEGDENGAVRRMHCIRMRLEEKAGADRPVPTPIPGAEFWLDADTVIAAVGQDPNPTVQRAMPALLTKNGVIAITQAGETSLPRIYAGGDVVRGGSTVIEAFRDGRAAAAAIDQALSGLPHVTAAIPSRAVVPFRIVARRKLADGVFSVDVEAADIARRWRAGQFVIVRPTATSERIPLTIVESDNVRGTICLVFQVVGKTTRVLALLRTGEALADVLGPLGKPAQAGNSGTVWCVAGGVGVAEVLPVTRALEQAGNEVIVLAGVRTGRLRILERELEDAAAAVYWAADDGSGGFHGTAGGLLRDLLEKGHRLPRFVHVIGPIPLMRAVAEITREWGIPTVASLNPIMLDGTGMCGGCRVSVGGKTLFACVDGPEFDAHQVDFDQLALRNRAYLNAESAADRNYQCASGAFQSEFPRAIVDYTSANT
jgi:glutamate synthase (NADPH/NADH) small chain